MASSRSWVGLVFRIGLLLLLRGTRNPIEALRASIRVRASRRENTVHTHNIRLFVQKTCQVRFCPPKNRSPQYHRKSEPAEAIDASEEVSIILIVIEAIQKKCGFGILSLLHGLSRTNWQNPKYLKKDGGTRDIFLSLCFASCLQDFWSTISKLSTIRPKFFPDTTGIRMKHLNNPLTHGHRISNTYINITSTATS
jgi:hypothetical protein